MASPHAGRSGEGARVSARRPGPRPLGCGSAPTARGGALPGGGSLSQRELPRGPGRGTRGTGAGEGKEGEEGVQRGEPSPEREKRGEGETRREERSRVRPPRRPARCASTSSVIVTAPGACLLPVCSLCQPGSRSPSLCTRPRRRVPSLVVARSALRECQTSNSVRRKVTKPVRLSQDLNNTNRRKVMGIPQALSN